MKDHQQVINILFLLFLIFCVHKIIALYEQEKNYDDKPSRNSRIFIHFSPFFLKHCGIGHLKN